MSENVEWISLPKRLTFGMRVALEIAIERHADDVDRIYRELLDFAPNPPEPEYERGRKAALDAITCEGADGEIYNSYVGGTDLREFLS